MGKSVFATPDFGAGAAAMLCLLVVWAAVLLAAGLFFVWGLRLLVGGAGANKRRGWLLVAVSLLVPMMCCVGPSQVYRLSYGVYPLGTFPYDKIKKGMTSDEVLAVLGPPAFRGEGVHGESWYYDLDSFGLGWVSVDFDGENRVVGTHGS